MGKALSELLKDDTERWGALTDFFSRYTNVNYPFPVDPPHVPYDQNETGCYLKTFELPKGFEEDQLRLRFEGVDSAFHVWVNGKEIGYSQGSRNPSEFDITKSVYFGGENVLAVKVYQYSDGSYIEDQVRPHNSMALQY